MVEQLLRVARVFTSNEFYFTQQPHGAVSNVFEIADWSGNQVERSCHVAILSSRLSRRKPRPTLSSWNEAVYCPVYCLLFFSWARECGATSRCCRFGCKGCSGDSRHCDRCDNNHRHCNDRNDDYRRNNPNN